MARLGRLGAVLLIACASLIAAGLGRVAYAGCAAHPTDPGCMPTPKPTTYPSATPESTPEPTAKTTAAPTVAPTQHPVVHTAAPAPVVNHVSTPEPTFEVEVPSANPEATPKIVVQGPVGDSTDFEVAEPAASASSWIFGFIVGFLIGAIIGRASWGLRKRRRQQIFG